jgi:chemotaxis protein CheD
MPADNYSGEDRRVQDDEAYFNAQFDAQAIYLEPGQTVLSKSGNEMIVATVGSGIVVSVYDVELKMGALGYMLLSPDLLQAFPYFNKADQNIVRDAYRPIVETIMEMKRNGAGKNRIRVRLMGGSDLDKDDDRGTKNFVFAQECLMRQGLSVSQQDLGGHHIRRVHFFPKNGQAVRRVLRREKDYTAINELENTFTG